MQEMTLKEYAEKVGLTYINFRQKTIGKEKHELPGVIGVKHIGRNVILTVDKKKFKKDSETFGW